MGAHMEGSCICVNSGACPTHAGAELALSLVPTADDALSLMAEAGMVGLALSSEHHVGHCA